jgi:membrane-bound lytic murein transglycosylase A
MKAFGRLFFVTVTVLAAAIVFACYPALKKEAGQPEEGLKEVRFSFPKFRDDMDRESLTLAVRRNFEYLDRLPAETVFHYGGHEFTCRQVREGQEAFLDLLSRGLAADQFTSEIEKAFRLYRATGRTGERRVLFTGYYEPVFEGRLAPDETFRFPLYRAPDDLIRIDLSPFGEKFKGETVVGRLEGDKVLPYYSRNEIDAGRVLEGRGLEIGWLRDPVEVAFLHIQGSGRLRLPDGKELIIQYQASNGRAYRSIGRYMIDKGFLTREELSMQTIRSYLRRNPEVLDGVLNHNPSYVFFRQGDNGPMGSLGVVLTPGRSVALDPKIFPPGALGFISSKKPVVSDQGEITGWTGFSRFILNQDTGGAIKGAGRVDLFWGDGPYAELAAGHLQHDGNLYIFIKKP